MYDLYSQRKLQVQGKNIYSLPINKIMLFLHTLLMEIWFCNSKMYNVYNPFLRNMPCVTNGKLWNYFYQFFVNQILHPFTNCCIWNNFDDTIYFVPNLSHIKIVKWNFRTLNQSSVYDKTIYKLNLKGYILFFPPGDHWITKWERSIWLWKR